MQTKGRTPIVASGSRKPLILGAFVLIVIDQLTKALAVALLEDRPPVKVLGSFLQLQFVRNPGAAFSLGQSTTYVFTAVAVIAVVFILRYAPRVTHAGWRVALGLVLAGACGNLIDRLFRAPGFPSGHVVDFIQLPMWPIFNVADCCISIAIVLVFLLSIRGIEPSR